MPPRDDRDRATGPRPSWWPADERWPPERGGPWGPGRWQRGGRGGRGSRGAWFGEPSGGDEGWTGPPWRRGGFMRRLGCLVVFAILLTTAMALVGLRAVGSVLGLVTASAEERVLSILALAAGVAILVLVVRMFRHLAAPVGGLVDAAGRIEQGDYSVQVAERGPREVRSLARAFNTMSRRLAADDARRRTFLADMAHELRTPLTLIQARLEAVLDGVHPADAEHLAPILDQTRQMEALVADLRTLALAEAGALSLALEPVDPQTLVNETIASLADRAAACRVTISLRTRGDVPVMSLDPARIRQVLVNLLINAIEHTPAGGSITVDLAPGAGGMAVTVSDSGPGIPAELLPRVFDRFVKAEGSTGSGLGLAICRDLVVAHGGTITATSPPDGGATIRFELPAA
jgi:two-component system sensor histidine kinase BaeS